MSATGRGGDRVADDFYPTPAWCTRRILEAYPDEDGHDRDYLEPCAGDGAIVKVLRAMRPSARLHFGDVRATDLPNLDVRGYETWNTKFDVVITNPPFNLAPEIIRHFLPRCDWLILLLRASFRLAEWRHNMPDEYKLPQRPEFCASEKCKGGKLISIAQAEEINHTDASQYTKAGSTTDGCDWSRKVSLSEQAMRICPQCGGRVQRSTSDAAEYSWFVWTPERNRTAGLTRVLPDTPLEERKIRE